jgi:hypothetical protein
MKRRQNRNRKMKTNYLLLGAVILTAITFNTSATTALLSPRAASNQIKRVHVVAETPTIAYVEAPAALLSPRAASNQTKTVKGTDNSVNPAMLCKRDMTGSPKAIAECASHPGAPMPCCNLAAN